MRTLATQTPAPIRRILAVLAVAVMFATLLAPQAQADPTPTPTPTPTPSEPDAGNPEDGPESGTPEPDPAATETEGTEPGVYDPPTAEELEQAPNTQPQRVDPNQIPTIEVDSDPAAAASCPVTFGVVGGSHTDGGYPISGTVADDGDGIPGTYMHHNNAVDTSYVYYTTRDPYVHLDGGWARGGLTTGELANHLRPHMFRPGSYGVLMVGTNDILRIVQNPDYRYDIHRSMRDVARIIENTGLPRERILMSTLPPINGMEGWILEYNDHLRALAADNGIRIYDAHALTSDGYRWRPGYTVDGVHFNKQVGSQLGQAIAHELNAMTGCVGRDLDAQASRANLGPATTGVNVGLRNYGKFRHYTVGSVYVSGSTPATSVQGRIRDTWASMGWENGYPGYPTESERCGYARGGCYSVFERSAIYWSPASGAHEINGATREAWGRMGWENSWLGYPTSIKHCGLVKGGCLQRFEGGTLYWSAAAGTGATRGRIMDRWGQDGWERGHLGYPTTNEICGLTRGGCFNHFQSGSIYWTPGTGAHVVKGRIKDAWAGGGWERGRLGYPTNSERCDRVGCVQNFEGGRMVFRWDTGRARPEYR